MSEPGAARGRQERGDEEGHVMEDNGKELYDVPLQGGKVTQSVDRLL